MDTGVLGEVEFASACGVCPALTTGGGGSLLGSSVTFSKKEGRAGFVIYQAVR